MTTPVSAQDDADTQGFAMGTTVAAAALLLVAGIVGVIQGIAALAGGDYFIVDSAYAFSMSTAAWGWVHLIVGILAVVISYGMFVGSDWGRAAAMVIAGLSIIVNFIWLPFFPVWAIVIIILDVFVIWAVATWRADSI